MDTEGICLEPLVIGRLRCDVAAEVCGVEMDSLDGGVTGRLRGFQNLAQRCHNQKSVVVSAYL